MTRDIVIATEKRTKLVVVVFFARSKSNCGNLKRGSTRNKIISWRCSFNESKSSDASRSRERSSRSRNASLFKKTRVLPRIQERVISERSVPSKGTFAPARSQSLFPPVACRAEYKIVFEIFRIPLSTLFKQSRTSKMNTPTTSCVPSSYLHREQLAHAHI